MKSIIGLGVHGCLLLAAAGLSACAAETTNPEAVAVDGTVAETTEALNWQPARLWATRDIPVCWETSGFDQQKSDVKSLLRGQESWSEVADVNFVGWGTCTATSKGIRVELGNSTAFNVNASGDTAHITLQVGGPQDNSPKCDSWPSNLCYMKMALPMFGRALGFDFEDERLVNPASCAGDVKTVSGRSFGPYDPDSVMNRCSMNQGLTARDMWGADAAYGQRYAAAPSLSDYNGDGRADLLSDELDFGKEIDLAAAGGVFGDRETDLRAGEWCDGERDRLFTGDFNGDGRADLFCKDLSTGYSNVDYASSTGFSGSDFVRNVAWCDGPGDRLFLGDFSGDGRADQLCLGRQTNVISVTLTNANGRFGSTTSTLNDWCMAAGSRLYVGDFNGDGRDDLLCRSQLGHHEIDYASPTGTFGGTDFSQVGNWCSGYFDELHVGDFNGDGRDDLLCVDRSNNTRHIDYANWSTQFTGTDWEDPPAPPIVSSSNAGALHYLVGDVNGDGHDDLIRHDVDVDWIYVALANSAGQFFDPTTIQPSMRIGFSFGHVQ